MTTTRTIDELVTGVYAALRTGDAATLDSLLAPDFVGVIAAGMPAGAGVHEGPAAMRADGWWAIGRAYAVLADPDELIPCADGRLLVTGTYRGTRRADDFVVEAAFTHLWTARDGRLVALTQVTDTERWTP